MRTDMVPSGLLLCLALLTGCSGLSERDQRLMDRVLRESSLAREASAEAYANSEEALQVAHSAMNLCEVAIGEAEAAQRGVDQAVQQATKSAISAEAAKEKAERAVKRIAPK